MYTLVSAPYGQRVCWPVEGQEEAMGTNYDCYSLLRFSSLNTQAHSQGMALKGMVGTVTTTPWVPCPVNLKGAPL